MLKKSKQSFEKVKFNAHGELARNITQHRALSPTATQRESVGRGIATLGAVEIGRRITLGAATLGAENSQGGNFGRRITLGAGSLWAPHHFGRRLEN